ncbi:MAG: ROK family protein [Bacteroidetes bacterium]|nr:MAG: ROK family protein [Bacteroidota bacterium]
MKYYTGIEIGGTKLQLVVGDEQLNIIEHFRYNVNKEKGAAGIREQIESTILNEILEKYSPVSIGVGYGGPVDHVTGKVRVSHHIGGWSGFELSSWLHNISGLPVKVDNDANTASLGEAVKGAGQLYDKVFYVTLGSGMGGGLVIGKELFHGNMPGESEIGLTLFDKSGANFESRCCGWAVDGKVRQYVADHPETILAQLVGEVEKSEAQFLLPAIQQDDAGAIQILESTADDLAFGLSHIVHLFNPEVIIIGGGLSLIGDPILDYVKKHIGKYLTKAFQPGPEIKLASLGEDVVGIGALLLAKAVSEKL